MGFGCNAVGVVSCRIIDSPRERLIAALTNVFVPCNGRFPTLIALATILVGGAVITFWSQMRATLMVALVVVLGITLTLLVSWGLSRTLLKGKASAFALELPPYRWPKIGEVLVRSVLDRVVFVLARAVFLAAPAGGFIWILANFSLKGVSMLSILAGWLQPLAQHMGLDGFILLAFILGLPANEIVLPILIMSYISGGSLMELDSMESLRTLLIEQHGWSWLTAVCVMVFSLCHWPCGTTLYTIYKEQKSAKWTIVAVLIPTLVGVALCVAINYMAQGLGLI